MFKKIIIVLTVLFIFQISNAQFLDDDLAAIERIQNQKHLDKQKAQKAAAARQAKINADRAAKQAKIDAINDAKRIKMDSRDDENYELEMEIKRMELMARKKELEQKARRSDINISIEEAEAERIAAIEKARLNNAEEYIKEEIEAKRTARDVLQSEADVNRNVSEGVKNNLSKKKSFWGN